MAKRGNEGTTVASGEAKKIRRVEEQGCRFKENFEKVQKGLRVVLKKPGFRNALEKTIVNAELKAHDLNPKLYDGLNKEHGMKAWPTSVEDWCGIREKPIDDDYFKKDENGDPDCFLWKFATWMPNETDPEHSWAQRDHDYNEKVYHVICHFHWLITTFPNPKDDDAKDVKPPAKDSDFNKWLSTYNNVVEMFLDSERSLKKFKGNMSWEEVIKHKDDIEYKGYQLEHFKGNINSWKTFNQFFYRRFTGANHKNGGISPTENKIQKPDENRFVASPAYCTFKQKFHITEQGEIKEIHQVITKKNKKPENLCEMVTDTGLKSSDATLHLKGLPVASIYDLMKLTNHTEDFCGGTYVHYFLSPYDYHRYHVPVTGKVVQAKQVPGYAYLNVTDVSGKDKDGHDTTDGWMHAPDDAKDGYEFVQSRGLIVIDTKYQVDEEGKEIELHEDDDNYIGKVAILPIGMSQVSGVGINENLEGEIVTKGWEFGRFKFGGSDIILLFDKHATVEFNNEEKQKKEGTMHYKFGETIATITMDWDPK